MNRIGRRIIMCMLLIAALALVGIRSGNERGRQLSGLLLCPGPF
jgi:hypothetical protein